MTATDIELTDLTDLDWTPACQFSQCQADHPPATHEFQWRIGACHHQGHALCCQHCANRKQGDIDQATKVIYPGCKRDYPAICCDYKITPLGRPA